MSRPESVSSRMASWGCSSAIWRISWRFFSPPEKPSLRLRSANFGSICSSFICSRRSLANCRTGTSWPLTELTAVRRKLVTDTPGTSTGYCIARKMPSLARSSGVRLSTSSPLKVALPLVIR
jgi:hypothetical protein